MNSRRTLSVAALLVLLSAGLAAGGEKDAGTGTALRFSGPNGQYALRVEPDGFRFSIARENGGRPIEPHPVSGLVFNGSAVRSGVFERGRSTGSALVFSVWNENGERADVTVYLLPHSIRLSLAPERASGALIQARLGGLPGPAYGLADHGAAGDVHGVENLLIENDGGHNRFVSTFSIFPAASFGQVLISGQAEKRVGSSGSNTPHYVTLTGQETSVGIESALSAKHIYYFLGDPKTIYKAFSKAKKAAGYADVTPDYRLFGVGWEAWPLLSWDTNARSVKASLQGFIDNGYPLSWATVGSGFWEPGGTTTSFGRWNVNAHKYPEPDEFRVWLRDRGIALLLGLRTQFVDGLGVNTGSGRDGSAGAYLEGKPVPREYREGKAAGYFAQRADGRLFETSSDIFPQWDESLVVLDSNNPAAIEWYVNNAQLWGSDGWKEDSMLTGPARIYHDGHWNPIMTRLHERGNLVVARNAYVSTPGSVQRLNDTDGEEARIPLLTLAYAASGSPNVYTDIVGNYQQDNARYLERHAKLQALTASMGLGIEPWKLPEDVSANILSAARWHHRYQPFLFSAARRSAETGFPYTLTPLPIAYPHDTRTRELHHRKMWQWMIGETLLAHPLFDRENTGWRRSVYLPAGDWLDPNTGARFSGPVELADYDHSGPGMPVFIGGKGVLIVQDAATQRLYAEVWPVHPGRRVSVARFLHPGSASPTSISLDFDRWEAAGLQALDVTLGMPVPVETNAAGALVFPISAGGNYKVVVTQ